MVSDSCYATRDYMIDFRVATVHITNILGGYIRD